jgi:hypothetical protein
MPAWESVLATKLSTRHHVTTRKRLQRLGIGRRVVDRLCARGRLDHVGKGVLVGRSGPVTFEQRLAVACALTGGVVCYPSAGRVWDYRHTPRQPDVHVRIAHCRRVDAPEWIVGHYTIPTLWAHARRLCRRGRTGSGKFATVLAAREPWRRPARSDHELRLERAMRARGFPALTRRHPLLIAPGVIIHPDLGVPEHGFLVEVDHLTWHGGRLGGAYDRWRDLMVRASTDSRVERVTDIAIDRHLAETVEDLWSAGQRVRTHP